MQVNKWTNCYDCGWKDIITPESFSHPAKMSYSLLKRILEHAGAWLEKGDVILDPFGGIGSTAILGAYEGYQVVCCELEQKFVDLAEQNFELHKDAWVEFGHPFPVIIQGDSRRLCEVFYQDNKYGKLIIKEPTEVNLPIGSASLVISSPPYVDDVKRDRANEPFAQNKKDYKRGGKSQYEVYGNADGQLGAMKPGDVDMVVSSPPFNDAGMGDKRRYGGLKNVDNFKSGRYLGGITDYGQTPGNLGNLKSGDVDAIISSPPYSEAHSAKGSPGGICDKNRKDLRKAVWTKGTQGESPDNLGNLKSGDVDCVISSPPYEGTQIIGGGQNEVARAEFNRTGIWPKGDISKGSSGKSAKNYIGSDGQIGATTGDTFWQAAKIIVEQCHQILKPGGHAIWVVKSFVRNKKIVDFPGDWRRLCESVGFKTVCIHHAMLVKETKHKTLFGHTEVKRKERKSFFRRLAESKGSPRIDFEVVLCMQKQPLFPMEPKK